MVDIYPKVNSLLRVGMNPFLVFVAYFFLEDSAADFFIQYSACILLSYILDAGLSFFILSQDNWRRLFSVRKYFTYLVLVFPCILFISNSLVPVWAWFFSLTYIFCSILRRMENHRGELGAHLMAYPLAIAAIIFHDKLHYDVLALISVARFFIFLCPVVFVWPGVSSLTDDEGLLSWLISLAPFAIQPLAASLLSNLDVLIVGALIEDATEVANYKFFVTALFVGLIPLEVYSNYLLPRMAAERAVKEVSLVHAIFYSFIAAAASLLILLSIGEPLGYLLILGVSILSFVFFFFRVQSVPLANYVTVSGGQRFRVLIMFIVGAGYSFFIYISISFLGISSTAASLLALSSLSIFQFVVYRAVVRRSYG